MNRQIRYRIVFMVMIFLWVTGVQNAPVPVFNPNSQPILVRTKAIYEGNLTETLPIRENPLTTSFSEMMSLPTGQLTTTYLFPWYNNVDIDTKLKIGNVGTSSTTVTVTIAGTVRGSYDLIPNKTTQVSYPGLNNGPVKVESSGGVPSVAAELVTYTPHGVPASFSEMMGLPNRQLDTTYWLPWYNNVDLDTQLRFGNLSDSTATVHIYIAGQEMANSPFTLAPGQSTRQSFPGINNGPVKVESDMPIVTAERVIYKVNGVPASFSELMGLPNRQLDATYWLPWYNNVDLDTQLRFGNLGDSTATVRVYIGDVEMTSGCLPSNSPYALAPKASLRVSCTGVNDGPVHVFSTSGQPILASERAIFHSVPLPSATYYVSPDGNDSNPGTQTSPWQTIQKAVKSAKAGDTVYIRGGEYAAILGGWSFQNSGTQAQPITLSNYAGEQVVIKIGQLTGNYTPFNCLSSSTDPAGWQTTKADFIRILGTDVSPRTLSDGVVSKKGIVIQGIEGEQVYSISVTGCDYWEVAGIDFIETAAGIRTWKHNYRTMDDNSADYWYVHNNRVYNYYRESGMQLNGDNNLIENNEIYKVSNRLDTPYGCQLLNILGNNNVIRGNTLSRLGSTAKCAGILFEWDLADANTVEQNLIFDVTAGVDFQGGDNNIIRNNIIYVPNTPEPSGGGIEVFSYNDSKTDWPCNEESGSAQSLLPANNPAHPDYQYYYNPRNCHSFGNQIYNNVIHGFVESVHLYPLTGENTIIRNNVFSGWTRGSICYYTSSSGTCNLPTVNVTADHNADQGPFGFVDIDHFDFHLIKNSPLIDTGLNLGSVNSHDFDGNPRPQGTDYDIGAYEYLSDARP